MGIVTIFLYDIQTWSRARRSTPPCLVLHSGLVLFHARGWGQFNPAPLLWHWDADGITHTLLLLHITAELGIHIKKKKISFIAYACRQYFHHPARNSASKVNARLGELSNSAVSLALDYAYLVIHEPGQNISSQQKGVSIHN